MKKRDIEMLALGAALNQAPAPRTEYVTQTIHEHRAPTDESIRLAKEYEEKAWKTVENRILEDVPEIDTRVVIVEECYDTREKLLFFRVNGRPIKLRFANSILLTKEERNKALSEQISHEIMMQLFRMKI